MAAINGVKNPKIESKQKDKSSGGGSKPKVGVIVTIVLCVISMLLVALGFIVFWKYYYEEKYRDSVVLQIKSNQVEYMAYHATRDLEAGEYLVGNVETVAIPSGVYSEDLVVPGDDISVLKASIPIAANSLISKRNAYDPVMQNPVLEETRMYPIDYISMPGVNPGDFVDIHIKTYDNSQKSSYIDSDGIEHQLDTDASETYRDYVVCSKIEILAPTNGAFFANLSKSDILNLNSAVIQSTTSTVHTEIYVAIYVDPANQPKASVTYNGKGIKYNQEDVEEAQRILRENGGVYEQSFYEETILDPNQGTEGEGIEEVVSESDQVYETVPVVAGNN